MIGHRIRGPALLGAPPPASVAVAVLVVVRRDPGDGLPPELCLMFGLNEQGRLPVFDVTVTSARRVRRSQPETHDREPTPPDRADIGGQREEFTEGFASA